jgi:hypothetical protein
VTDKPSDAAGPTGDFPQGQLNADDEGGLIMAISSEGGCVRLDFGKPTAWIALPPDEGLALASLLVKRAMALKRGET